MKRNAKNKPPQNVQKITAFFKTAPTKPAEPAPTPSEASDDIIPPSPETPAPNILNDVTNGRRRVSTSTPEKKRKNLGRYPDDIPELDVEMPRRKKPCSVPSGVQVLSLAEASKSDLDAVQAQLEKAKEERMRKMLENTPEKACSPAKQDLTRSGGKRKTPKKLFSKSPKVGEFDVEVLERFVRITPSKSQEKRSGKKQMAVRSAEKKQRSILDYASPSTSHKSVEAQNENEKTPVSKPSSIPRTPVSGRVKMKLDFTFSTTLVSVQKPKNDQSPIAVPSSAENINYFSALASPEKNALAGMLDDSWEENFQFTAQYTLDLSTAQHCRIVEVTKSTYMQTLKVQATKSEESAICTIADFWFNTKLSVGDTIYLTAVRNQQSEWVVNNNGGLLVYEPDFLISSTSVVGALFCKRKSVLKDRYGGFDPCNKVMIVGTLVHTLLQTCLRDIIQTAVGINALIKRMLTTRDTVEMLFDSSLSTEEMVKELGTFTPRIVTFMQQYMSANAGMYPTRINRDDWIGKIDTICDIEENIWSPELGVKGKVDVSVRSGRAILPLELKTGRASMSLEHRGQIILYIMMMEQLGYNVPSGLLLYLREGVLRNIPMVEREKRDLMILRNDLAYYLTRRATIQDPGAANNLSVSSTTTGPSQDEPATIIVTPELPPPISHHSACSRCEYATICCVYLEHDRTDLADYRHLNAIKNDIIAHLDWRHIQYFVHWSALLAIEMGTPDGKPIRDIYTKSIEKRVKNGGCIANLQITTVTDMQQGTYTTHFVPSDTARLTNFLAAGIGASSYVVVSERNRPAVAAGIVVRLDHAAVTVELERNLTEKYPTGIFHLDTYNSNSINTFNFTNLAVLMQSTDRAALLRQLIINRAKPTFRATLPQSIQEKIKPILRRLNKTQQRACIKSVAANDYVLIKGMPGTGKTATIVALVQVLVSLNQSVLITSHTNLAVDNVCIRLLECGVNILRIGSESRIHPNLRSQSEHSWTKHCKTPEELEEVYQNAKVLAVTCIGSRHSIFSKRLFDVCIVDESTQVLQTSLVRALSACKKFILIGDPDQLPPVVRNKEAQDRGLSESLFERLQCPEATVTLNLNYRMNKPITELSNDLTYKGQLLIANDSIANANLRMPKLERLLATYNQESWVLKALDSSLSKAVYVLDTGPIWEKKHKIAGSVRNTAVERNEDEEVSVCSNPFETAVVVALARALLKGGISADSIGIIAPYRAQVAQISMILQSTGIDISTVDQFQGQDKDVILYSCTKSRDTTKPKRISKFEILEDKRRLTVAITRAKHKFIMLADVATIREYSPFSRLFNYIPNGNYLKLLDDSFGFNWETLLLNCGPQ